MSDDPLKILAESAARLGMSLDEVETAAWLDAIAASVGTDDVVVDVESGVFGHRVSMLDYSPRELARFREIGAIVEVTDPDGVAETALALSGSAAQSKIQSYPGDADFFQRLNIPAPTREEACATMARLMRDTALKHERGPTYQFLEAKLGSYPVDTENGSKGSPITWHVDEIKAQRLVTRTPDGVEVAYDWNEVALDPGWCKLDWVVVDPVRHVLSNASNVIDVTWEAPDGSITPLDGYLDAFFQEVYLDAGDVPMFAKLARHVSDDALDEYVESLENEVRKYLTKHLNYGKAAKRMYNVFRLSGRHLDAALVRELFDEPTTILYRVWALVGTLDNATQEGSSIPLASVLAQADTLIAEVQEALDGDAEAEIVARLVALRATLDAEGIEARSAAVDGATTSLVNAINTFFHDKLNGIPSIKAYIEQMQAASH